MPTAEELNRNWAAHLPGLLGIEIQHVQAGDVRATMAVTPSVGAPDGHLHAGSVVALAVHVAGCGCVVDLPPAATGFTTLELKVNYLGGARDGNVACIARRVHGGRSTQVWDIEVVHGADARKLALVRCTQMILY